MTEVIKMFDDTQTKPYHATSNNHWKILALNETWYIKYIELEVREIVRHLHAQGIHTNESCQGGPNHGYEHATVILQTWGFKEIEHLKNVVQDFLPSIPFKIEATLCDNGDDDDFALVDCKLTIGVWDEEMDDGYWE